MEWLAALLIVVGIVGTVVPLLPGSLLVAVAVIGYAAYSGERVAWIAAGLAVAILAIGWLAKWLVPAKKVSGDVHNLSLAIGGVAALIGFFVIPVVGLVVGFVGGVFLAELGRTRAVDTAWPATKQAIKAAGLAMLIELASTVLAGALWGVLMVFY